MYDDFINQRQYIASSDKSINSLNETEHAFFSAIAPTIITKGEIAATDAVRITGKSPQRVRQLFSVLVDKGFLVATGQNKGRKYTFKSY